MSGVPTGKVVRPARPYDWLEDERSQRDEEIEAVEAYDPDDTFVAPERVDLIALRPNDLIEQQWNGFVTSQLPDLTVDHDRTRIAVGRPRKSRRRGPPPSPINPRTSR